MPDTFLIRDAISDDAEAACTVLRRSITELCQLDHQQIPGRLDQWLANKTPETLRHWTSQDGLAILVAEKAGAIAGVAGMTNKGDILLNYVSPDWRFRGVSKALLAAMEAQAIEAGLLETKLESSKTALHFYQARNYRTDPERAQSDRLWLIKSLV